MSFPRNHSDFRSIVGEPVEAVTRFPDIHSGQASDVWLIQTPDTQWIVRSSRLRVLPDMDFWVGCHALFGIDPSHTDLPAIHRLLRPLSVIPVPTIQRSVNVQDRWFHVVERLPGSVVKSFSTLPADALFDLGVSMATIHGLTHRAFGRLDGQAVFPASGWTEALVRTMQQLVARYYLDDGDITGQLEPMCQLAHRLPAPRAFAPIMLDLDPTQFLSNASKLTGLVDLEVYAFGPPEFELCMLEYLVEEEHAAAFRNGYETVAPLPSVSECRPLYRYLGLLLAVQGRVPYQEWMQQATRF